MRWCNYNLHMTLQYITRLYRTSTKAHMVLSSYLMEVAVGCMLGDLHAEKPSANHNTRLQFKQSAVNLQYIIHLFELFNAFCGTPPLWLSWYDARPNKLKIYHAVKFQTFSLGCFNILRELFYNAEGVKVVPGNIRDYFTVVSLAHRFMDDGYKTVSGYLFCTESFSQKDLDILLGMLSSKFGLECTLHKTTNGPRLYIRSRSVSHFNELVKPHMVDCFLYKLHN